MYLYRAVDKQGKTVGSYLSRTRDVTAAKAFFRKALKRPRRAKSHYPRWLRAQPCALRRSNARRVLSGVELVFIKAQFGLLESFGTDPFQVWYNVRAASGMHLSATDSFRPFVAGKLGNRLRRTVDRKQSRF
jgi:hypothetical protein